MLLYLNGILGISVTFLHYYGNKIDLKITDEYLSEAKLADCIYKSMSLSLYSADNTLYYKLKPYNIISIGSSIYQFEFKFYCSSDLYIAKLKIAFTTNIVLTIDNFDDDDYIRKKTPKNYKFVHYFNTSIINNKFGRNNIIVSTLLINKYTEKSKCIII